MHSGVQGGKASSENEEGRGVRELPGLFLMTHFLHTPLKCRLFQKKGRGLCFERCGQRRGQYQLATTLFHVWAQGFQVVPAALGLMWLVGRWRGRGSMDGGNASGWASPCPCPPGSVTFLAAHAEQGSLSRWLTDLEKQDSPSWPCCHFALSETKFSNIRNANAVAVRSR